MPRATACVPCLPCLAGCCSRQQKENVKTANYELTTEQPLPIPKPALKSILKPARKPVTDEGEQSHQLPQDPESRLTHDQIVASFPTEQQGKQQDEQSQKDVETRLTNEDILVTAPVHGRVSQSSSTVLEVSTDIEHHTEPQKEIEDEQAIVDKTTKRQSAPANLDNIQPSKDRRPSFSRTRFSFHGPAPFPPPSNPLPALPSHEHAYAFGQQRDAAVDEPEGSNKSSRSD